MPRTCKDINEAAPTCEGDLIGIQIRGVYDGVLFWICSAGHAFPRDFQVTRLNEASIRYAAEHLQLSRVSQEVS